MMVGMVSGVLQQAGLVVLDDLFVGDTFERLCAEAVVFARDAREVRTEVDGALEDRGGQPAMSLHLVPGGPIQTAFYRHPTTRQLLERLAGCTLALSGPRGCLNVYGRPGDHMALHRDTAGCDVTLITCLLDEGAPPDAESGALQAYPRRRGEPLSAIRRTPESGGVTIRLRPGQSVVMSGGAVAHRVVPVALGQRRVVSALCYRVADPDEPSGGSRKG